MKERQKYIEAGKIVNTHGVRGEIKIEVWLDSPEFLQSFSRVYLEGQERKLLSARVQKQFLIAVLDGVADVNEAMKLKGKTLYIDREDANLPEGAFFQSDILKARIMDEDGAELGVLTEILERPASNIYVFQDPAGIEHLVPAVPEFIRKIDVEAGTITVHLIKGM